MENVPTRPGRLVSATATIRETAKWIMTGFAGLAAVLVAGLRFADVGKLEPWHGPFFLALVGAAIAFASLGYIVWLASEVLTTEFDTLREILIWAATTTTRKSRIPVEVSDNLIRAIVREEDYLYRTAAESLSDLYGSIRRLNDEGIQIRRENVVPSPEEEHERRVRTAELDEALERVVDFADHWMTKKRFDALLRGLLIAGTLTAAGVFIFALGISRPADPAVHFEDRPVPAKIFLTGAGQKWATGHLGCAAPILDGMVVGRESDGPQVATPEQAGCKAGRFVVKADLGVVVPTVPPK